MRRRVFVLVAASAAVLLVAAAIYARARPTGQLWPAGVPRDLQVAAASELAARGYSHTGAIAWAATRPPLSAPDSYRLFFAARASGAEGEADVYVADATIDSTGRLAQVRNVDPLTRTPAGSETAPLLSPAVAQAGGWLAFATQVAGRYQSVTLVPLDDLGERQVYAFDRPPEALALAWSGAPGLAVRLALTATAGTDVLALALDPATHQVEPPGASLAYVPAVQGEFSWLPNLVSRVRELPGVGPEKIAFLENVFFTAQDRAMLWWHGLRGGQTIAQDANLPLAEPTVPIQPTAAAAEAESQATAAPTTEQPEQPAGQIAEQAERVAIVLTATAELTADSRSAQPTALPILAIPTDPKTRGARYQPALAASPRPSAKAPAAAATKAQPAAAPGPAPAIPPEGLVLGPGILRHPAVQPDPQRPYAVVDLIEIDPSLLQIKMVPGTVEPRPSTGLVGTGVIPEADRPALVAGFNGGFAAMHGAFGLMTDRKVYLPARSGVATLAVYEDGSLRMGTWGKEVLPAPDMVAYRQNCPPLIEHGTITAETGKLTLWGLSVSNEVYLYRSGLGLTADGRLVYAAGKSLTAYTLARALQMAGAVYAMQLDVDEYHVAFITYDASNPGNITGRKLRDDMRGFDGLFLRPFQLDFFYLVRRPQPLAEAVRMAGATAVDATGPAGALAALSGQLAFASNRDGNWELYVLRPGQSDSLRRLTQDPADDTTPAWSPDGRRLAFSSRRSGNSDIFLLNTETSAVEQITRQPSEEWAPAWSPDGTRVAYQSDRNGQSDIFVAALPFSAERRLTPQQGNHESPHWSPDGGQLVFDSDLDVAEQVHASINVYVMAADGSAVRRLYDHGESPAWSPDGRRVAFTSLRGGHWQVLILNVDGSGLRQITSGGYDARYPAWSPDGHWLAFAGNANGRWELYVAPVDAPTGTPPGTAFPYRLTDSGGDSSYPAWGP